MADETSRPSMAETAAAATRRAAETMTGLTRAAADTQAALLGDVGRMFREMRFPGMLADPGALLAAHRRNMEALAAANRLALEGAQAVARRNMEIMQQTMHELSDHVRELSGADDPQVRAARQAELMKRSYEHATNNLRELADLIQKSNAEAVRLLDNRFREAMDEVRQLLETETRD